MTDTIKVIAQLSPTAATLTTAYTVPVGKSATLSSISICNTTATVTYFRISIQIAGAADSIEQYLYYDLPLDSKDTFIATIGITLSAGDIITAYAFDANVAFNYFGVEI